MYSNISENIKYIGIDDMEIDLFESQYTVEEGMTYNSYIVVDEKIALMDTADSRKLDEWEERLLKELDGREPNFLVISHMEPDHSMGIKRVMELFSNTKIVGNTKTFKMMEQFFGDAYAQRQVLVSEGETLSLGEHTLQFFFAPMVHWPEVMVTYEQREKVLFSADAFGKFGSSSSEEDWACEARRYYYNIVGKYGANVQALLKKLQGTDLKYIAPLHGPILSGDLSYYLKMYDIWSKYQFEDEGVMLAYASIHGHTKKAAERLAEILESKGAQTVKLFDLSRGDQSFMVEDAFQTRHLVLLAASYDAGVFPPMEHFLHHLKSKNYQDRRVAIVENGSWAPSAAKVMRANLEQMKNLDIYEPTVTIRSCMNEANETEFEALSEWILR